MFRGNRKFIAMILIYVAVIAAITLTVPSAIDWTQTYEKDKKEPYACFILYRQLKDVFPGQEIKTVYQPAYNQMSTGIKNANYIFIANSIQFDELDFRTLYGSVSDGNYAFLAANIFPATLCDSLGIEVQEDFEWNDLLTQKEGEDDNKQDYRVRFTNPNLGKSPEFVFRSNFANSYFSFHDTLLFTVLAVDAKNRPVFVRERIGEGFIYLSCFPQAFTNYYLVNPKTRNFASHSLSYLPVAKVFWDEFYKAGRADESDNPLRYILRTPALKWALCVSLLALLLFVIFRAKRRQRIIPVIAPYQNTTLEFVTTIGRLYFNKADHFDLVTKQRTFWLEYVRTHLLVPTQLLDEEFIRQVSERSAVPETDIRKLVSYLETLQRSQTATEHDVHRLHEMIENFYTKTKR